MTEQDTAEKLLSAASGQFLIMDYFIQKLLPQDDVAATAQILHLNDIRNLRERIGAYLKQAGEDR